MKLTETARLIDVHLQRFEADPNINKRRNSKGMKLAPYWNAHACIAGNRVAITYLSFQGCAYISRKEAEAYLAWLDAGNVGCHWQARTTEAKP